MLVLTLLLIVVYLFAAFALLLHMLFGINLPLVVLLVIEAHLVWVLEAVRTLVPLVTG